MDDILYLVHSSYGYNNTWTELKISAFDIYQYPGVYFSLITKDNINSEIMYSKPYLIFSKRLLEQKNYHINYFDNNGHINEKNTYYPWNIDKVVKKIANNSDPSTKNRRHMNEVVFHDNIPMKYLCAVIYNVNISYYAIPTNKDLFLGSGLLLPIYPIFNDEPPDMSKIPFYCYPYEENYTGPYPYPASSKKFYKKMALMCNIDVDKNKTVKKIKEEIRAKIPELINNRQLLRIEKFKK